MSAQALSRILESLDEEYLSVDDDIGPQIRKHREEALPLLREFVSEEGTPPIRLANSLVALHAVLGEESNGGRDRLVGLIADDPAAARIALRQIGWNGEEAGARLAPHIDSPELREFLHGELAREEAEPTEIHTAVALLKSLRDESLVPRLLALLRAAEGTPRFDLLAFQASLVPGEGILDRLLEYHREGGSSASLRWLRNSLRVGSDAQRRRVFDHLDPLITASLEDGRIREPVQQSDVADFLDRATGDDAPFAERIYRECRDPHLRGKALLALARLGWSEEALDLDTALRDREVARAAAEAIALIHRDGFTRAHLDRMASAAAFCSGSEREPFLRAIVATGHPDAAEVVESLAIDDEERIRILGPEAGWDLRRFATFALERGLTNRRFDDDDLEEIRRSAGQGGYDLQVVRLGVEAGFLVSLDLESDEVPPPYVSLVVQLASLAGDTLAIEKPNFGRLRRRVSFRSGGRNYAVRVDDLRDYFHIEPVVGLLNEALADQGASGRFVLAEWGGQDVVVAFGAPPAARRFLRKGGIAVPEPP